VNELELIRQLTQSLPSNNSVITGAGDDCAVIDLGIPNRFTLFKVDAVTEGVHFTNSTSPEKIGRKALARPLSDIAAMAGTPSAAVITLALPDRFEPAFVKALYSGMNALAREHNVAIAGGETTSNPERLLLSIALLGTVAKENCLRRSGAKVGDAIFVTGKLGGSIAGHHLDFQPRLKEAQWLAANFPIHCMIDLSDGLASDLAHLLNASNVGAELLKTAIPISRAARLQASSESSAKPPLLAALTDGEDFELLFTISASDAVPLHDGWKSQFPDLPLSCIGKISPETGLRIRDKDGVRPLSAHGYVHFA
jgi:thiamine-monophosphate kinase